VRSVRELTTSVGPERATILGRSAPVTVVLGHGAGGGIDSADLQAVSAALVSAGTPRRRLAAGDHPPEAEATRGEELAGAGAPVLVVPGERDPFGTAAEVAAAAPSALVMSVLGADHALARGSSPSPGMAAVMARWSSSWGIWPAEPGMAAHGVVLTPLCCSSPRPTEGSPPWTSQVVASV
jgi:hypothetical protein